MRFTTLGKGSRQKNPADIVPNQPPPAMTMLLPHTGLLTDQSRRVPDTVFFLEQSIWSWHILTTYYFGERLLNKKTKDKILKIIKEKN